MSPLRWLWFACRHRVPGLGLLLSIVVASCSGGGEVTPPTETAPKAAAKAAPAAPAKPSDPLPLDAHASAMAPRWYLPEHPAFTPHWYTPSVDPLFRRHVPAQRPHPRGQPAPEDDAETGDAGTAASAARHKRAVASAPARQASARPGRSTPPKDYDAIAPALQGIASWYGPGFHGKATASGEVYNQHSLTAAHPNLPLGSIIRVENERNGRVVWVRVNDRGPYAKGRILDLSRAAAERLNMVEEGTAPVRISVLRWPQTTDRELGLRAYTQFVVQVAAYPEPEKAEELLDRLEDRFDRTPFLLDPRPNGSLAVIAGPYDSNGEARRVAKRLRNKGFSSMVRRYRK